MTWFGFLYLQKGWPKKRVGLGPSVLSSLLIKSCREFFLVLVAFGLFDLVFNAVCKIFLSLPNWANSQGACTCKFNACTVRSKGTDLFTLLVLSVGPSAAGPTSTQRISLQGEHEGNTL